MHYLDNFAGLGKQVYILCLVRVVIATGCMASFMTPLLYSDTLGFSDFACGILISLNYLFSMGGTLAGGKAADRFSRKKVAIALMAGAFFSLVACGLLCRQRVVLVPFIVSYMCMYAMFPVVSAMVADCCKPEKSTESFSLLYLVQNVGFAAGPAIGGIMFYSHLEGMFYLSAVLNVVGAVLVLFFAEDHYHPEKVPVYAEGRAPGKGSTWSLLQANKPLFIFIGSMVVISMCYQMLNFNLSLQMADLFGLEDGSRYSGLVWTVNGITVIALTPLIVGFTRRTHQFRNMTIALLFYALGFGMYGFVKTVPLFFVATVVWTLGEIMINTGAAAFIAANSPATHVARFQSALETATAAGKTISPVIYGALLGVTTFGVSWCLNAILCILISGFLAAMYRKYVSGPGAQANKGERDE